MRGGRIICESGKQETHKVSAEGGSLETLTGTERRESDEIGQPQKTIGEMALGGLGSSRSANRPAEEADDVSVQKPAVGRERGNCAYLRPAGLGPRD